MDRTTVAIIKQAFQQAKQSGGGTYVGGEDVLLALATEPSLARDVLADLGVTPERIRTVSTKRAQARAEEIGGPPLRPGGDRAEPVLHLDPTAHAALGRAEGLALAWGHPRTEPEHWLLAVLYSDPTVLGDLLDGLGTSADAIVAELRRRGAQVPEVAAPTYRPWRGSHHLDISAADWEPLLALLRKEHPPGSPWRWSFNYFADDADHRGRVHAEESIDLLALLAATKQDRTS
ncbi:Clp protease N-terminal domain-containing protein [Candidatus Frankia alpina]|uniref:Clp protease N-terminal domain-containing protein n=1 Tax=Candidatus Frankia alpina TaxID=2699483 RepID=UPI0013D04BD3|nr:Clp protease N-terminal domain-containing protein [Candidatus Frankia alpina]